MTPLATALIAARRSGHPADDAEGPPNEAEADRVADEVAQALLATDGPVVAWKVGAASPTAEPSASPIHAASLFAGAPGPRGERFRVIGAEAELAYRFDRAPDGDIEAAIGAVHVAIELLDTRYATLPADRPLLGRADQGNHGALIIGPGRRDWQAIEPVAERVTLTVDGRVAVSRTGGNGAGDPLRLLRWLAGHASRRGWPLTAGTIVTTGSCTGTVMVAPAAMIRASFGSVGRATWSGA